MSHSTIYAWFLIGTVIEVKMTLLHSLYARYIQCCERFGAEHSTSEFWAFSKVILEVL